MTDSEISRQIDARLEDLHRRHRSQPASTSARYYTPGRGYHGAEPGRNIDDDHFGIAITRRNGRRHSVGTCDLPFPMQSISKVFTYALALEDHGREHVLSRVGVEPSGDSYRSLVVDERAHRPHNPMVNAGALVAADLVRGSSVEEKLDRILALMRRHAGHDGIDVDRDVYRYEASSADRNRGTVHLLRSEGMIDGDAEEVLALYLQQCSVMVTCVDLSMMAATLANGGVNPATGERAFPLRYVRDVLSVMYTCGMYDFAGEWAFEVGVPAKSGVSGGILAAVHGKLGLAVHSPGLDLHGNSIRGVQVCQEISNRLGVHVFASEEEDAMLKLPDVGAGTA